mmetsp:Transcript_14216/g.28150  ORF Transcript_14216/g.28150 Transcript_14216/m.28150 type:complete len:209 (-) Transcript_14216:104-730(-)|eukprot:CAMPEP_0172716970 /NCGR_PEP_ID=MMETSP1074-20121228/69931_1 /TAXON_ID=2916 /ORGANISM="Ceratium fusus, Strain PA161109" /LENGTH=208 /DNA_ID=CAMNT_0013541789 /DNA_START=69 /DNA_END=695 /DNA_ORIENTATION=-
MSDVAPQSSSIPCFAGTRLEPFLQGFQECGFRFDVDKFVTQHAPAFAETCPDGSHPLVWTDLHKQYRELFDDQLDTILEYHWEGAIERHELVAYCEQLAVSAAGLDGPTELPGTGGVRAADFNEFLSALTASEDYLLFVQVMRQRASTSKPSQPSAQEIEVTVPDGYGPGQVLAVDWLGARYELQVPEGCRPGTCFRAQVLLAALQVA